MVRRLVLGCGPVGHRVVESLARRPDDLYVLDPDPDRVETLRGSGVPAERGDPIAPDAFPELEWEPDTVLVLGDNPGWNRRAAEAAAIEHPSATLVGYTGRRPTPDERDALAATVDRLIDHGDTAAAAILASVTDDPGDRLRRFLRTLRGIDGRVGVFMHDNPDPDAIASAIALQALARTVGTDATVGYFGEISHQENRALVNLLELDLRKFTPEMDVTAEFDAFALVDHSRPGVNDQLPPDVDVAVVIDHHPPREPIDAAFVDLRSDVGATSTLLTEYLRQLGIEPSATVATALLYGIRVDTRDFTRELTETDFEAAAYLLEYADGAVLRRIETPSVTGDTLDTIARSIKRRRRREDVIAACVGRITDRDALAQAAEQLLSMEGVTTTFVYGILDGTVYASARSRGGDLDIGEVLRDAFDQIGSAGGHADMAGAQLPLGIIGDIGDEPAALESVIADVMTNRFFEVVEAHRRRGQYVPDPSADLTSLSAEELDASVVGSDEG